MAGPLVSILVGFLGLFWIAASLTRHDRALFGEAAGPGRRAVLRVGGAVLIGLSPLAWIAEAGAPMALSAWLLCGLPISGVLVVLALAFAPRAGLNFSGARLAASFARRP